jgi:type VI secretion system secreted protein Hcp
MPVYIQYETIDGDVTEDKHKKWIEVNSFQIGVGRGINTPVGSTAKREVGAPSVSDITITKNMDISSYRWLEESLYGQKAVKCTVHFMRTGEGGSLEQFCEYIFTNCLVSGYTVSSSGSGASESVNISFTKLEYTYIPRGEVNTSETSKLRAAFDLSTAKKA